MRKNILKNKLEEDAGAGRQKNEGFEGSLFGLMDS